MKRLIHEQMREIDDLMKKEHPDTEKYKVVLEKGLSNLEKHKQMAFMIQNVLRVSYEIKKIQSCTLYKKFLFYI